MKQNIIISFIHSAKILFRKQGAACEPEISHIPYLHRIQRFLVNYCESVSIMFI